MKKRIKNSILRFLKLIYLKLFRINDTPQKIALGAGLGVCLGILPGTGPIAAIFMAFILRVNRAAALLGSLLTNTWLSFVTFVLSIKIGSSIMGISWQDVYSAWLQIIKNFKVTTLFKTATIEILLPLIIGYFIVSVFLGIIAYLTTLIIITKVRRSKKLKHV
ncbi:MAG: DUF2062 domain-containing protein [Candidatus Omnitrophica bacterium]|nr:DUF2062 domain-containing protein [Candidatus Omnitrophota bacterium]